MSDRVVGNTLDGVIVTADKHIKKRRNEGIHTAHWESLNTEVISKSDTYVYFKIPSSFDVQMMMLLSADPEANLLPAEHTVVITVTTMTDKNKQCNVQMERNLSTIFSIGHTVHYVFVSF